MSPPATTPRPRVSVIIPAFNAKPYLWEALDSALLQAGPSFEIVIVNDGSTDGTDIIIDAYSAANPGRFQVIHQENQGLPAARNAAINASRGEYLALLDADDAWLPGHLARSVHVLDNNPHIALVHANINRVDQDSKIIDTPPRSWHRHPDAYEAIALRYEHVSCPTAVFRRSVLCKVGVFDTRFTGLGCEDKDLWLRLAEHYSIWFNPVVSANYRIHPDSMSKNRPKMLMARRMLVDKMRQSPRGAALANQALAMIDSELGVELMEEGLAREAFLAQCSALSHHHACLPAWKRLVRTLPRAIGSSLAIH